jgi:hypothetical protein
MPHEAPEEGGLDGTDPHTPRIPFKMRKQINATTYEVEVYFNPESKETMDDKILRLIRGTAVKEENGE